MVNIIKQIVGFKLNKELFNKHIALFLLRDKDWLKLEPAYDDIPDEDIDAELIEEVCMRFIVYNYMLKDDYIHKFLPKLSNVFDLFIDMDSHNEDWYIGVYADAIDAWSVTDPKYRSIISEDRVKEKNTALLQKFMTTRYTRYKEDFENAYEHYSHLIVGSNEPTVYAIYDQCGCCT